MTCTCTNPTTTPIDLGDVCDECGQLVYREDEF